MAWTTPRCWVTGEVVTAALLNAQLKSNMEVTSAGVVTAAGDLTYASASHTMQRLSKGTDGNILHQASCIPAWTASPSLTGLTLSGALDVNGTIDYDGTDVDVLSSGDIDLVSSANAAAAIYIAQSTGTSGTVKIHADTGTSVTEGAESINILSDVGGVGIRSTANLAKAVNITSDGGTTGSISIFNDQGTSVTEGAASIALVSDAGGVELRSTANLANAINITSDGGTTGTISIFNDLGSSVTEGAESISLLSDAGGVGIRSTANLANAVNITADGGTTSTIQIYNDQGTAVNEGVASIQLLSDVGGIGVKSGLNAAGAIRLTADAGTSETIMLHADQGSGAASICLTSDAGGITLNPGTFVTIGGIADGEIRLMEDSGAGTNYVAIKAQDMSASYTLTLPVDDGCCGEALTTNGSGTLTWAAGGTTINNATADELVTVGGTTTELCAEANLTFDGTDLQLGAASQIFAGTGVVCNPGFSFRCDPNTGIYRIGADELGFVTGGLVRMQITNTTFTLQTSSTANTVGFNGSTLELKRTSDCNYQSLLMETAATCGTGIRMDMYHNSPSPADGDSVGEWNVSANDSCGTKRRTNTINFNFEDVTACTINSKILFYTANNSAAMNTYATLSSAGVWTDASAEADKSYEGNSVTVWGGVDGQVITDKIKQLNTGRYHSSATLPPGKPIRERHLGPTAEQFWDLFGVSYDPRNPVINQDGMNTNAPGLSAKDLAGAALLGIQEILVRLERLEA